MENVVLVPHIASATRWTREGMAVLTACNVAAKFSRMMMVCAPESLS